MSEPIDQAARNRALDAGQSFIVQAPAGSGKTTLLVERYLTLLAHAEQPEGVLAITFTRKAAADMARRVRKQLLAGSTPAAQAARARDLDQNWQLGANPTRLKIQTIDSFAMGLVQRMPRYLDRQGFTQPAEHAHTLLLEAASRTLHRAYDPHDPLAPHVLAVLEIFDQRADRLLNLLTGMLDRRDQWIEPVARLIGTAASEPDAFAHSMNEAVAIATNRHRETILASDVVAEALSWFDEAFALNGSLPAISERVVSKQGKLLKRMDVRHGVDKPLQSDARSHLATLGEAGLEKPLVHCALLPQSEVSYEALDDLFHIALVLYGALDELDDVFHAHGYSDFTELTLAAERALGNLESPTELAMALDHRIEHILVDEFQDTSSAQLKLFERLTENWHPDGNETFFAVGDPMQSIYRFRDADVSRYLDVQRDGLGQLPLENLVLECNFRSSPTVVAWCNATFSKVLGNLSDPLVGRVAHAASEAWLDHEGEVTAIRYFSSEHEAQAVVRQVRALIDAGKPEQHIAILVRSRPNASAVIRALNEQAISWQGTDMEPLAETQPAHDVLNLLRALGRPLRQLDERAAWSGLLTAPYIGIELTSLETLFAAPNLRDAVRQYTEPGTTRAWQAFDAAEQLVDEVPPREVVETYLYRSGAIDYFHTAGLTASLQTVLTTLDALGPDGLDINQAERALSALYAPDHAQAQVQVMTIHKAKGLEFDHVFLPALCSSGRRDEEPLLHTTVLQGNVLIGAKGAGLFAWLNHLEKQAQSEELSRLLYVACTRAISSLHLSWVEEKPKAGTLAGKVKEVLQPEEQSPGTLPSTAREIVRTLVEEPYRWQPDEILATKQWATEVGNANVEDRTAAALGIAFHRALEFASNGMPLAREEIERTLRLNGVPHPDMLADTVIDGVARMQAHERGAWILSAHTEATSEQTLACADADGNVRMYRVDRMFVDASGDRWIIDYKLNRASDPEVYAGYLNQLNTYRALAEGIWSNPVRTGLFYLTECAFEEVG